MASFLLHRLAHDLSLVCRSITPSLPFCCPDRPGCPAAAPHSPEQRHRLPARNVRISSSVGSGFSRSRAMVLINKAGIAEAALLGALVGNVGDKRLRLLSEGPPGSGPAGRPPWPPVRCRTKPACRPAAPCTDRSWPFHSRALRSGSPARRTKSSSSVSASTAAVSRPAIRASV